LKSQKCDLFKCKFSESNKKVHHHDNFTGKYNAPLCNSCNRQLLHWQVHCAALQQLQPAANSLASTLLFFATAATGNYRTSIRLVFIRNLSEYDTQLFVKKLGYENN
jgi:hypothetical protein